MTQHPNGQQANNGKNMQGHKLPLAARRPWRLIAWRTGTKDA